MDPNIIAQLNHQGYSSCFLQSHQQPFKLPDSISQSAKCYLLWWALWQLMVRGGLLASAMQWAGSKDCVRI